MATLAERMKRAAKDGAAMITPQDGQEVAPTSDSEPRPESPRDEAVDATVFDQAAEKPQTEPGSSTVPVGEGLLAPAVTAEPAGEGPVDAVGEWPVAAIPGSQAEPEPPAADAAAEAEPAPAVDEEPVTETVPAAPPQPASSHAEDESPAAPTETKTDDPPASTQAGEGSAMPASTVLEDRTEVPRFELVIDPNAAKDVERYSDSRNRSRSTTVPITVTTTNDALEWGRRAFSSDEDALDPHPTSFVRWIQRAVHLHLHRTPQERAEVLAEAKRVWNRPESRERKRSYNVPMPYDLNMLLEAAIPQERKAGRRTSKSGLVRDAMLIEVVAAADRAGGELPHLEGKLPHAR